VDVNAPPLWLISGEIGVGKTALCRALAGQACAAGWDVAGLLSPGVFEARQKTAIQVEDLRSGERRLLASLGPRPDIDLAFGRWYFNRAVLAWGNHVLEQSVPCDLLIVDELGPLELLRGQGFTAAQASLAGGRYRLSIGVVRPTLVETFSALLPPQRVVAVDSSSSIEEQAASLWGAIAGLSAVSNAGWTTVDENGRVRSETGPSDS
jgi:nucleoside-triphosphatase